MFCQFLLQRKMNHLCIYFYPISFGPPFYSGPHSPLSIEFPGLHSMLPRVICFTHGISSVYVSIPVSQFLSLPLSPLVSIHSSSTPVSLSISALQIESSIPFFQIPHVCVRRRFFFLFLIDFTLYFLLLIYCVTLSRSIHISTDDPVLLLFV